MAADTEAMARGLAIDLMEEELSLGLGHWKGSCSHLMVVERVGVRCEEEGSLRREEEGGLWRLEGAA